MRHSGFVRVFLPIALFATLGFLVMGYHPGAEDDGVYLAAVKADLNPSLFPHDAAFFQLQMHFSVFDNWMAGFVEATGIPLAWAELLWQWASIFLIVWSSWSIIGKLFEEAVARWAGVAMLVAMFTLPVAGTALYIADQYLHPRNLATAFILFAVSRILAGKVWQAVPLVAVAFALHPLMGAFGVSFCFVLALTFSEPLRRVHLRALFARPVSDGAAPVAAIIPFAWIFNPPSQTWLEALHTRYWFRLYEWKWYEWLGAIAPLLVFWLVARAAHKRGETKLARFSTALVIYGTFQQAVAMVLLGPRELIAFSALEPMRYLQLVYVFLALIGGAYLGRYALKANLRRWAAFLLVANGAMFFAQRELFAGTTHIELPAMISANPWLQAFDWIKQNTPHDAHFALDPNYMAAPGEDNHGFRALAERSVLSDAIKDTAVISKVPELGPLWHEHQLAQAGWQHFKLADFERLKVDYGVNWVLVAYPQPAGLACRWHNGIVSVCEIP